MKLTFGSKRADMVREFFYWVTFMRACDKLDNVYYAGIITALISAYFINRAYTDTRSGENKEIL